MTEKYFNQKLSATELKFLLCMIFGSIIIGIAPFLVEYSGVSAETNTFYRLLIGSIFFAGLRYKKNLRHLPHFFVLVSFISGLLLFLDLFLCNQSILFVSPGIATVLSNLEIIFLIILGKAFFKEPIPKGFLPLLIIMIMGVFFLIYPFIVKNNRFEIIGIIIALSSSLSYGLYVFLMKYILVKYAEINAESLLAVSCLSGAFIIGLYMLINEKSLFFLPTTKSFLTVIINGFMTQVIGWWLISKSIRYLSLSVSGAILLLQPLITFLIDITFFDREAENSQVFGVIILVSTIYIITCQKRKLSYMNLGKKEL